jgi:hypothetical protein
MQVGGKNLRMTDKLLHSPEVEGVQLLVLQRSLQECVGIKGLDGRVHIHFLKCASRFENCLIKVTVEDSKTSRNMCEDLLGFSHKQAK